MAFQIGTTKMQQIRLVRLRGSVAILIRMAAFTGIGACACRATVGGEPPPAEDAQGPDSSAAVSVDALLDAQGDTQTAAGEPDAGYDPASPILPVLWIDVRDAGIDKDIKTPGTLKVIELHDGTLKDIANQPAALEAPIGIERHGATSDFYSPKKSYGVELRDASGMDRKLPLLGMPSESDWVLYSCFGDYTCMRNALVYAIGRDLGRYNPSTRYVEVFLNGALQGLYLVVEKIKPGKNRVPLARPAADAASGDITGGYIFRREDAGKGMGRDWTARTGIVFTYDYPRPTDITPSQSGYLQDYINSFLDEMAGTTWADPQKGYRSWIDVPSWVDFALMQEFTNNVDAYLVSNYLQKLPQTNGGKLLYGPLWDYNFALGSVDFRDAGRTDIWNHLMNRFPRGSEGAQPWVPFFWEQLWTDPAFLDDMKCRWQELRRGALELGHLHGLIDGWVKQLRPRAQPRDYARWMIDASFSGEVKKLGLWIDQRVAWLDANMPGRCSR